MIVALFLLLPCLSAQTCILTPELTVGPYYYDTQMVRQNITDGKPGVNFILQLVAYDQISCQPLKDAAIDIWHCDAGGYYSWFNVPNTTFLRGIQFSDSRGNAKFDSIYPGWYQGRDTHIHVRLRIGGTSTDDATYSGGTIIHTGQLFFHDSDNDQIALLKPYSDNTTPRTPNDKDNIYLGGGNATLMNITFLDPKAGYAGGVSASITLLVNTSANYTDNDGPPGPPPITEGEVVVLFTIPFKHCLLIVMLLIVTLGLVLWDYLYPENVILLKQADNYSKV